MTSTKTGGFRFCPFCGESFRQLITISFKFCPSCGQSLSIIFKKQYLGQASCDKTKTQEEINQFTDETKDEKKPDTIKQDYQDDNEEHLTELPPHEEQEVKDSLETQTVQSEDVEEVCENTDSQEPCEEDTPEVFEEAVEEPKEEPKEEIEEEIEEEPQKEPKEEIEEELKEELKEEVKKIKEEPEKLSLPTNTILTKDAKYYSVVIKACCHKKNLGHRLEKILVRDFSAISLALDSMPSVIVYKSKVAKMASVVEAFYKEHAAISVIPGNFDLYATIEDKYSNLYELPQDTQDMLLSAPPRLWLGDKVYLAVNSRLLNQDGVLTVTDQGLYFLDNPGDFEDCRWLIVPYYRVAKVDYVEDETGCALEVQQKSEPDDIYPATELQKFYISDSTQAKKILALVELSLETGTYLQKLFIHCSKCGWNKTKTLNDGIDVERCPKCNAEIKLLLLKNSF